MYHNDGDEEEPRGHVYSALRLARLHRRITPPASPAAAAAAAAAAVAAAGLYHPTCHPITEAHDLATQLISNQKACTGYAAIA